MLKICPDSSLFKDQRIQGLYGDEAYRYFEVEVVKCQNATTTTTNTVPHASQEDIDSVIEYGDVEVRLSIADRLFDVEKYHNNNKNDFAGSRFSDCDQIRGVTENDALSWRIYIVPEREQLTEVYYQARSIRIEGRFLGSPPLPEKKLSLTSFHSMDTTYKKANGNEFTLINFYFRLHPQQKEEEMQYWIRSLLDLFGYWGAMASFLTVCSFGLVANLYNRWKFTMKYRIFPRNCFIVTGVLISMGRYR